MGPHGPMGMGSRGPNGPHGPHGMGPTADVATVGPTPRKNCKNDLELLFWCATKYAEQS